MADALTTPTWLQRAKRALRHHWFDERRTQRLLPKAAQLRMGQAVELSERGHSAELRVCIEGSLPPSYLWRPTPTKRLVRERALAMFGKLRVWDTEHNNGVLLYLQLAEHAIEIVADRGFNGRVTAAEWQATAAQMGQRLKTASTPQMVEAAVAAGLQQLSALMQREFPAQTQAVNPNELPNLPHVG